MYSNVREFNKVIMNISKEQLDKIEEINKKLKSLEKRIVPSISCLTNEVREKSTFLVGLNCHVQLYVAETTSKKAVVQIYKCKYNFCPCKLEITVNHQFPDPQNNKIERFTIVNVSDKGKHVHDLLSLPPSENRNGMSSETKNLLEADALNGVSTAVSRAKHKIDLTPSQIYETKRKVLNDTYSNQVDQLLDEIKESSFWSYKLVHDNEK